MKGFMNRIGTGVSCSNSTPGLTRSKCRSNAPVAQTLESEKNKHWNFNNLERFHPAKSSMVFLALYID